MRRALVSLLLAGIAGLYAQAAPVLQVIPAGGMVFGNPGAITGWGFTLTNISNYLVITGSSFVPVSLYGTYQDFAGSFNFIVAGPAPESTEITQNFNASAHTGVGSFSINSTAPSGTTIAGNLVVQYSLFSQDPNDPNFNPDTSLLVADATISQPATVNITPEPASWMLIVVAGLVLAAGRERMSRSS